MTDREALLLRRLEHADVKIGLILDLIHEELRRYPGDEGLRLISKILDIINGDTE
jgi:hypothetical protein